MRRRAGLLALSTGLLVVAAPAWAEEPQRTAWFNALSAGPLALPAPTQDEGDLRVGGSGSRPTAYATLALRSEGSSGELVLKVADAVGTPELALCPTKSATWEEGGNQPFAEGPEYDCSVNLAQGMLSSDGTSVSFTLDSGLLPAPGSVSLAVVPLPEASAPFQVDLREPVFTLGEEVAAEEPVAPPEEPAQEPAGDPGTGTAEAPPLSVDSGPVEEPVAPVEDAPAPELAGVEAAPLEPAAEPAEAAPLEPEVVLEQVPSAVQPVSRVAAGEDGVADGPRVLALLTLVAVSAGAGYAAGQQRTTPRIIGGRARALPAGGAAPGGALAVAEPQPAPLERGIGRFSRLRDAAPRRLR